MLAQITQSVCVLDYNTPPLAVTLILSYMPRDYKKRSSKPRRQARRGRKQSKPAPIGWLLSGLFIGLFAALLVYLWLQPKPVDLAVKPQQPPAVAKPAKPVDKPRQVKPEKSKYDFYTMLPEAEVIAPVDDYRHMKDPVPLQESTDFPSDRQRYQIQAGSFTKSKDADRRKAELALLGIESAVKKIKVHDGKRWYRVIVGPFDNLENANQVQTQLHSQKIKTLLVRVD